MRNLHKIFVLTSAKMEPIFLASLKLVKEAGSQLMNKDNKHLTSHISKHLWEWGTASNSCYGLIYV